MRTHYPGDRLGQGTSAPKLSSVHCQTFQARNNATPLLSTTLVLLKLNPMAVKKIRVVNAQPNSIAVIGVDAASGNVWNNQADAATYAEDEAMRRRN